MSSADSRSSPFSVKIQYHCLPPLTWFMSRWLQKLFFPAGKVSKSNIKLAQWKWIMTSISPANSTVKSFLVYTRTYISTVIFQLNLVLGADSLTLRNISPTGLVPPCSVLIICTAFHVVHRNDSAYYCISAIFGLMHFSMMFPSESKTVSSTLSSAFVYCSSVKLAWFSLMSTMCFPPWNMFLVPCCWSWWLSFY